MSNLKPAPISLTASVTAKLTGDRPAYGKGVTRIPVETGLVDQARGGRAATDYMAQRQERLAAAGTPVERAPKPASKTTIKGASKLAKPAAASASPATPKAVDDGGVKPRGNLKPAPFSLTPEVTGKLTGDRPAYGKGVTHVPLEGVLEDGVRGSDARRQISTAAGKIDLNSVPSLMEKRADSWRKNGGSDA